jgi:hypothetical protein
MNAGSTMTSRDSHEVRHIAAERHARSGWPRGKNDASRPAARNPSASALPVAKKIPALLWRQQAEHCAGLGQIEREKQALPCADQSRQKYD